MFLIWKPTTCVVHWQAASFPKDQDFWIWPVDRHRRRRALASLFLRSHGSLRTYECLAYEAEKPLLKRPRKQSKRSGRDHQFTNSEEWVQVRPLSVAFRSYFNMNLLRSGYQWAVSMFWSFKKDLRTDKTSRNAKTKQAWSSDRFDFCGFVTCGKNFFASCAERSTVMTGRDICTSPAAWWWFTSFWQEAGFDGDRVETTWFRLSGSIVEQNRDQFYAFSTAHGVGKQNDGCSFQNVVSDWMIEWVFFNTQKKGWWGMSVTHPSFSSPRVVLEYLLASESVYHHASCLKLKNYFTPGRAVVGYFEFGCHTRSQSSSGEVDGMGVMLRVVATQLYQNCYESQLIRKNRPRPAHCLLRKTVWFF